MTEGAADQSSAGILLVYVDPTPTALIPLAASTYHQQTACAIAPASPAYPNEYIVTGGGKLYMVNVFAHQVRELTHSPCARA